LSRGVFAETFGVRQAARAKVDRKNLMFSVERSFICEAGGRFILDLLPPEWRLGSLRYSRPLLSLAAKNPASWSGTMRDPGQ
jgi:hypothetical protein